MSLDFTETVRQEFGPNGFLSTFRLRHVEQNDGYLVIEFEATMPTAGLFTVELPVPAAVGDELWQRYDETAVEVGEWARWGISVPILEAYETTPRGAARDSSGRVHLLIG